MDVIDELGWLELTCADKQPGSGSVARPSPACSEGPEELVAKQHWCPAAIRLNTAGRARAAYKLKYPPPE